jgi:hypothetical protein
LDDGVTVVFPGVIWVGGEWEGGEEEREDKGEGAEGNGEKAMGEEEEVEEETEEGDIELGEETSQAPSWLNSSGTLEQIERKKKPEKEQKMINIWAERKKWFS